MKILEQAGIGTLIITIVGGGCFAYYSWKDLRKRRVEIKEIETSLRKLRPGYEWKPHIIDGVDCGEWVRKDGHQD